MGIISGSESFQRQFGDHFRVGDHPSIHLSISFSQRSSGYSFASGILKELRLLYEWVRLWAESHDFAPYVDSHLLF